jgi:segregation and condensation protein B
VLYGTTREFLERLGLPSLEALPSLGDFVPDASVVEALERGLRVSSDPTLDDQLADDVSDEQPPDEQLDDGPSGTDAPAPPD